jgi:hypothetical protein
MKEDENEVKSDSDMPSPIVTKPAGNFIKLSGIKAMNSIQKLGSKVFSHSSR